MIRTGTLEQAQANRRKLRLANGTGYWKSELIASPAAQNLAPQAFLVEQDADSVILPHFHVQNEFQVIVNGGGSLGRHAVRPVCVHYAGAHTGYGPITAGADGLWYFTLRAVMDAGALFLPDARPRMQRNVPKRHLLGGPVDVSDDCRNIASASVDEVIAPQSDGIAAWCLRIPPGKRACAPAHPGGLGRFYLVLAGALRHAGALLPRWASVFVTAEDEPFRLEADAQGLEVLVLQFPGESAIGSANHGAANA
jgi:hypothetical protein